MFNSFFYYNRRERQAILVLLVVLLFVVICNVFVNTLKKEVTVEYKIDSLFLAYCDSFKIEAHINKTNKEFEKHYKNDAILFEFDPNKADSLSFDNLGLKPWMISNILKYRLKGGTFKKPEDFSKIYGLDSSRFALLKPYIIIDSIVFKKDTFKSENSSVSNHFTTKYPSVVKVDLNLIDTAGLKKIPGIGEGYANMIVNYRNDLGGYVNVDQINDIINAEDSIMNKWKSFFYIDSIKIRTININRASISMLKHHPYLNFYQAKVIVELRKEIGKIDRFEQLYLYNEFKNTDWEKLKPYFVFE
ncbi:MAG: helix-hairpin-helix domain-containing protein [Bacteroidales bacterium]|nr:helix-hairpin-helix domain-containing protein [Bacteroidales bacterium]